MSAAKIRAATRAELVAFHPFAAVPSIQGFALDVDGKILGVAGVTRIGGRRWAFLHLEDGAKPYGMMIVRHIHRYLAAARRAGVKAIHAQLDPHIKVAPRLMTKLGFTDRGIELAGFKLYIWRP